MPHIVAAADLEHRSDMTAMIDVVFLMIVFFLCIPFRTLEAKVPAFLPRDCGGTGGNIEPVEVLSVRVVCDADGARVSDGRPGSARYRLVDHHVRWVVGPRPVAEVGHLTTELARLAAAPACQVLDPKTLRKKPMMCVIEPGVGVCYDDVARTADIVRAAGFPEVKFGGGAGPR